MVWFSRFLSCELPAVQKLLRYGVGVPAALAGLLWVGLKLEHLLINASRRGKSMWIFAREDGKEIEVII